MNISKILGKETGGPETGQVGLTGTFDGKGYSFPKGRGLEEV